MAPNAEQYFKGGSGMRSLLLIIVAVFCICPGRAVVVAQRGSMPAPNRAGRLYPECTCPIPMPGLVGRRGFIRGTSSSSSPSSNIGPQGLRPGEVEVLTVDVSEANRVRCDNASVAADVAKLLKIPVKRITVTPWSWTLPEAPQRNYLAFLQEDHERCDCEGDSGHLQGFRKVETGIDGTMVSPGTSVMTVSQFKVMQAGLLRCTDGFRLTAISSDECPRADALARLFRCEVSVPGELCDGGGKCGTDKDLDNCGAYDIYRKARSSQADAASAASAQAASGSPPSRVQMFTRDPCLVHMLREMTPHFKKKIAFILGIPETKVIVDPPNVKGTVGLLQLETTVNSEEEIRQVPMLGVRQCNLAEIGETLLADIGAVRPASASVNASAAASVAARVAPEPMVYAIASPNNTNSTNNTNATNAAMQRVSLVMKLDNIDYDLFAASLPLVSSFTTASKEAIGASGHIPAAAVTLALYPGSVVIEAQITPPSDTAPEAVLAFLNGTVCNATADRILGMSTMKAVMIGSLECTVLSLTIEDPSYRPDETNRPWIASWSIAILPPFAQDGAWKLLQMVDTQGTPLSKLLPLTLARIAGLQDRSLKGPNAGISGANETRLPPPDDTAVGFRLPNPYTEEAALEAEYKRVMREKTARALVVKEKAAMENQTAQDALASSKKEADLIKQAKSQFTRAARVHAEAIRPKNAVKGPDIVPFEVLEDHQLGAESPYPWMEQVPQPPAFMFSLEQEAVALTAELKKEHIAPMEKVFHFTRPRFIKDSPPVRQHRQGQGSKHAGHSKAFLSQ